jgi:carboxyl-terminal processing protease
MFRLFQAEKLQGVWRSRGYGFLLEVRGTMVRIFHEVDSFCWEDTRAELRELIIYYEAVSPQTVRFTTLPGETSYLFDRISVLPRVLSVIDKTNHEINFQAFYETMGRYFAFFRERNTHWPEKKSFPNIETEAVLFAALSETIQNINDPHLSLTGLGKRTVPGRGKSVTAQRLARAFESKTAPKPYATPAELNRDWQATARKAGKTLCLASKPNGQYANGLLQWGFLTEKIGYIEIGAMAGFGGANALDENKKLQAELQKVFAHFTTTKALILDIAQNLGGEDRLARAVADCFTDRERLAYTKVPRSERIVAPQPFFVRPAPGGVYTRPVYLLTSDVTVSAAEILVLCLRALPNVVHAGQTTRGALSDALPKQLPNGWEFTLSNEIYKDPKQRCFEATGIAPMLTIEVYPEARLWTGHTDAIQAIIARADAP